jgi:modulator of FtsH protease HflC
MRLARYVLVGSLVALILASGALFVVPEGHVAVVTRFGAPRSVVTTAGLHTRLPWPVDRVHLLDARRRLFNSRFAETLTRDKRNVVLRMFAVWSVGAPLTFLQSVGSLATAEERLDGLVTNAKNATLGRYELSALVSTDPARLQIAEVESEILRAVASTALDQLGVRLHQIGLKQLGLPAENVAFVFEQMRTERRQYAARARAEGEREAAEIKSQTDLQVARARAEGRQQAAEIRARADAQTARIYAEAHSRDPELYQFLRSLDALKTMLGKRSTVIVKTDAAPFALLQNPGASAADGGPVGRDAERR